MSTPDPPRRRDVRRLLDDLAAAEPERAKVVHSSIGLALVLIPAGSFTMGSPDEEVGRRANEGPARLVDLTKPFYLGMHPVTQEQYRVVTGQDPSRFNRAGGGSPEHPVERVSWEDAVLFCKKLSDRPEEREAKRVYRLPTEAEWEYACRAGRTAPFAFGPELSSGAANFDGGYPYGGAQVGPARGRTSKVGAYPANLYGLYDLHGNVWEWCADWYGERYYSGGPPRDPKGPAQGTMRVVRGGCWRNQAATCRSAYRNALPPYNRDAYTGFRVACDT